MEQMSGDRLSDLDLQLDGEARQQLNQAGKWAKFISISVFVACVLFAVLLVWGGNAIMDVFERYGGARFAGFGEFSATLIIGIGICATLVVGVVFYFMFNFSVKIKNAMLMENSRDLNAGINSLKIYFILTSVFTAFSLLFTIYTLFITS